MAIFVCGSPHRSLSQPPIWGDQISHSLSGYLDIQSKDKYVTW